MTQYKLVPVEPTEENAVQTHSEAENMSLRYVYVTSYGPTTPTRKAVETWLNNMDEDGWELVSIADTGAATVMGIFRKPRPEK